MHNIIKYLFFSVVAFVLPFTAAAEHEEHGHAGGGHHEKKTGEIIIEHVADAHNIHFLSSETFHLSIPLPCLVIGPKGFDFFMSGNLYDEHGNPKMYTASSGATYYLVNKDGAEKIMSVNEHGAEVAVWDFSITKNVFGMFLAIALLLIVFVGIGKAYLKNPIGTPKGKQSFFEPLILFIRDEVAKPGIGHRYEYFMPFLLTIFFFILFCNVLGLIPFIGGFNITGNIAVTMVLALFTFFIMVFKANGAFWMHIIAPPGVPGWLLPLLIPIEIIGLLSKPMVLMLRLFANVTAGHIIILAFVSLIFIFNTKFGTGGAVGAGVLSMAFSIFMNFLELLVAFLQAYVFTLLASLYFGSAIEEAHH